ncbi:MAG: hypothetical protein Q8L48_12170 [Archangium sp.]|nr:hypothetical protein [Archangium sp.]
MKPLSKEARAALSALSSADPTRADEARVRKNLERALGVAIPTASVAVATTAVSAQAASGAGVSGGLGALGVGAKAVVFVLAVGVGSVVTVGIKSSFSSPGAGKARTSRQPASPTPPPAEIEITVEGERVATTSPPLEAEPISGLAARGAIEAAAPPAPPATPAMDELAPRGVGEAAPAPAPVAVAVRARPEPVQPKVKPVQTAQPEAKPDGVEPAEEEFTPPPAPPNTQESYELEVDTNFPNCDPGTELRSAVSARKLLNANRAEEAVWLLGAYQRRCPSGRWSDEAWSVRMAGLCKLGRNAEVIGLLQWFSTEYPSRRFAVVNELRRSCPEEVLKHGEPSAE